MKLSKALPAAAVALCVPGVGLRALHVLNGFDVNTGLPAAHDPWVWYLAALLIAAAVLYAVLAAPLRRLKTVPFEQMLGTESVGFRMAAVIAGLLLCAGGLFYLYLTFAQPQEEPPRRRYRFWVEFTQEDIEWFKRSAAERGFRFGSIK